MEDVAARCQRVCSGLGKANATGCAGCVTACYTRTWRFEYHRCGEICRPHGPSEEIHSRGVVDGIQVWIRAVFEGFGDNSMSNFK